MKTDAHLHISQLDDNSLDLLNIIEIAAISSCHNNSELELTKKIKTNKKTSTGQIYISVGVHPLNLGEKNFEFVKKTVEHNSPNFIGEIGLDKFSDKEKATFDNQLEFFKRQLALAKNFNLPVILHIRKAMNELFLFNETLAKLPAVIFHSYSGSSNEANHLLKKEINAYFSFGTALLNGHKKAIKTLKEIPINRILSETDAPYQPPFGQTFTKLKEIEKIQRNIAQIINRSVDETESSIYNNFLKTLRK